MFAHVSRRFADAYGVRWLPPLGFENTYAIAVRRATAARYSLRTLSDLARASASLTGGFTADFIGRPDGLGGLSRAYGMHFRSVSPLSPALKYQALAAGSVDVIDGYSTDGLLARYDLVTLADDLKFFPPYEAAALVSPRIASGRPEVIAALTLLSGRLDIGTMRALNRRVEVDREDVRVVARAALRGCSVRGAATAGGLAPRGTATRPDLGALTLRHLWLVAVALTSRGARRHSARTAARAHAAGGRTGDRRARRDPDHPEHRAARLHAAAVRRRRRAGARRRSGCTRSIPSRGAPYTGVRDADPGRRRSGRRAGTTPAQQLRWVRLPLAAPVIMAGVRTAAVITVGAATLAAFIGAGGLGEPIVEGLALADNRLILSGAIPAALLALVVDAALALVERRVRPAHLRRAPAASPFPSSSPS